MSRPEVVLSDGNSFAILGACRKAAKADGWTDEQIDAFMRQAMGSDYDHLLQTVATRFEIFLAGEEDYWKED